MWSDSASSDQDAARCAMCGREVAGHTRDVRFRLPDPVLSSPERLDAPGAWLSDPDPMSAVMMQIPQVGAFVRALLPVALTGGDRVTYGVWVGVRPEDLHDAIRAWWAPDYAALRLSGRLSNVVEPWDVLGAPVDCAVREADRLPYCVHSDDATLAAVLGDEWVHDAILAGLPG